MTSVIGMLEKIEPDMIALKDAIHQKDEYNHLSSDNPEIAFRCVESIIKRLNSISSIGKSSALQNITREFQDEFCNLTSHPEEASHHAPPPIEFKTFKLHDARHYFSGLADVITESFQYELTQANFPEELRTILQTYGSNPFPRPPE